MLTQEHYTQAMEAASYPSSTAEKMDHSQLPESPSETTPSQSDGHGEKGPTESAEDEVPPRDMKPIVWFLVAASVFSAVFLFALDNTIVADVQPKVIESFGEVSKLPWISVAFPLGGVAMNLIW